METKGQVERVVDAARKIDQVVARGSYGPDAARRLGHSAFRHARQRVTNRCSVRAADESVPVHELLMLAGHANNARAHSLVESMRQARARHSTHWLLEPKKRSGGLMEQVEATRSVARQPKLACDGARAKVGAPGRN
jgi:hypothetical protein